MRTWWAFALGLLEQVKTWLGYLARAQDGVAERTWFPEDVRMYGPEMHRTVAVSTVSACLASQGGALGGRRSTTLPVWGGYRYGRQTRRKAGRLAH